jgi:hypothetical protein
MTWRGLREGFLHKFKLARCYRLYGSICRCPLTHD